MACFACRPRTLRNTDCSLNRTSINIPPCSIRTRAFAASCSLPCACAALGRSVWHVHARRAKAHGELSSPLWFLRAGAREEGQDPQRCATVRCAPPHSVCVHTPRRRGHPAASSVQCCECEGQQGSTPGGVRCAHQLPTDDGTASGPLTACKAISLSARSSSINAAAMSQRITFASAQLDPTDVARGARRSTRWRLLALTEARCDWSSVGGGAAKS